MEETEEKAEETSRVVRIEDLGSLRREVEEIHEIVNSTLLLALIGFVMSALFSALRSAKDRERYS